MSLEVLNFGSGYKGLAKTYYNYDQICKWTANLKTANSTSRKKIFRSYPDAVFAYLRCLIFLPLW